MSPSETVEHVMNGQHDGRSDRQKVGGMSDVRPAHMQVAVCIKTVTSTRVGKNLILYTPLLIFSITISLLYIHQVNFSLQAVTDMRQKTNKYLDGRE